MRALKDRYGFTFWLKWILWFAGSFVLAALLSTGVMRVLFGDIQGEELTIGWVIAVFGSWFLLVIPFMRKKEQIWKRLNQDEEKAADVWFRGMGFFIGLLVLSALGWSLVLRADILEPGLSPTWVRAVFGSWLFLLIPFSIWMYRQADRIFKNAADRQQPNRSYRRQFIELEKRILPEFLIKKLDGIKPTLRDGHLISARLKGGEIIPFIFLRNRREIQGIYDREGLNFHVGDIEDIEPLAVDKLTSFEESKWIRLDVSS